MTPWRRLLVTVVLAMLIAPAVVDRDSFPMSTYPMYARSRGNVVSIVTANGETSTGETVRLTLDVIGNIDDPLIVASLLRDAVRGGLTETENLCGLIAGRAAAEETEADQISIVTETHRVVDRAAGRPSLIDREVHSSCPVPS